MSTASTANEFVSPIAAASPSTPIRPVDQWVLEQLRCEEGLSVSDFVERLEVTQTAVRIRLDRLEQAGLIERRKFGVGRGRPTYKYFLSELGWRQVGVNYVDLARALWHEIDEFPDRAVRQALIDRVSQRMGQHYSRLIPHGNTAQRLGGIASVLSERKIPCNAEQATALPTLTVLACPFPDLVGADRRSACELETKVLSEAVGEPLELSCCRLDGHGTCQFRPTSASVSSS